MAVVPFPSPEAEPFKPELVPDDVRRAIDRGRKEMRRDSAKRRLCVRFERGDQYTYLNAAGGLGSQPTITVPGDPRTKPDHRIRNAYNHIRPFVQDKESAATARMPGYEVNASTSDPEDRSAAGVSQKASIYLYDKCRLRKVRAKSVKTAITQGDAFAMPFFDPEVGPYIPVAPEQPGAPPRWVGQGEVRIRTLGPGEVGWEPGVDFDDSPWYIVERAQLIDEVRKMPGFFGPPLNADARDTDTLAFDSDRPANDRMVMVTDYLERPCSRWPEGRRIAIANGRVIVDARRIRPAAGLAGTASEEPSGMPWEPYPLRDHKGIVLDEPCIHRLTWAVDSESDRDLGLVWQLIDAQRTINDCINKLLEWKNRCLNPQMLAQLGSIVDKKTDEPGRINYYKPGFEAPKWETPPAIPRELFQIYELMNNAMQYIASYADATAAPNVAAKTVQATQQQAASRWESFLGNLAEFDSRLMRHMLMLVARYYTEPRLLKINGWFGADLIEDFRGSDLNGNVDVSVNPASLTQLTRADAMARVQFLVQFFPGQLNMETALAMLDGGPAANMIRSYELDVDKIGRIIRAIRDGSIMTWSTRTEPDPTPDPMTGKPTGALLLDPETGQPAQVPSWMPMQDVDNLSVWKRVLGDWMKTPDYEQLEPGLQEVAKAVLGGVTDLQARADQQDAIQQAALAQQMGASNATRPAGPKSLPSGPAPPGSGS